MSEWEFRERGIWDGKAGAKEVRENLFRLGRQLRNVGIVPEDVKGELRDACRRLGVPHPKTLAVLPHAWCKVLSDEETDRVGEAMQWADAEFAGFARPLDHRGDGYQRLHALAYRLQVLNKRQRWFPFPRGRIADWLGVSAKTAGKLIVRLKDDRLILLGEWKYKAGEARPAWYVGPGPDAKAGAA